MEIRITPKALWDIDNIFEYFISNDEKDVWNSFWVNLKSVFGMKKPRKSNLELI